MTIGALLSSVSLMLAAFGFFYNTQKDRIDDAAADATIPNTAAAKEKERDSKKRIRNSAYGFAAVALLIWALLLPEIVGSVKDAFEPKFDLGTYSTPHVIFFVAANAWLAVAWLIFLRGRAVQTRVSALG